MSDLHYSGHDPASGCGLMIATTVLVLTLVLAVLTVALAVGLWRP